MDNYRTVSKAVTRIIKLIDDKINTFYNYNEENVKKVSKMYIKKYLNGSINYPGSELKLLCFTSYWISLKYLLDSCPRLSDYCSILNVPHRRVIKKEIEIGLVFMWNFTPRAN